MLHNFYFCADCYDKYQQQAHITTLRRPLKDHQSCCNKCGKTGELKGGPGHLVELAQVTDTHELFYSGR